MTADPLRDRIAADCPHRLDDYDRHRARVGRNTAAFDRCWREEHAISSNPRLEARLLHLEQQAVDTDDITVARTCLEHVSRIRHRIGERLDKETPDA